MLEFFALAQRQTDPDLLEMTLSVASQMGQFIERHQMRARVVQSEKLASLGMLSAGIAHEINNPLAYIATNLAVLERDSRFLLKLVALYEKSGDRFATARFLLNYNGRSTSLRRSLTLLMCGRIWSRSCSEPARE